MEPTQLGRPAHAILTHYLISSQAPEINNNQSEIPTFDKLVEFLDNQTKILQRAPTTAAAGGGAASASRSAVRPRSNNKNPPPHYNAYVSTVDSNSAHKCLCTNIVHHHLFKCPEFHKMSPHERFQAAKNLNGCINCLSTKHKIASCQSASGCRVCKQKHHSLLHFNRESNPSPALQNLTTVPPRAAVIDSVGGGGGGGASLTSQPADAKSSVPAQADVALCSTFIAAPRPCVLNAAAAQSSTPQCNTPTTVLLATAMVATYDSKGNKQFVRVLLDSASQSHFITSECCDRLGLRQNTIQRTTVRGFGGTERASHGTVDLQFFSRFNNNIKYKINSLVVDKITDNLPTAYVDSTALPYLNKIALADDHFATPNKIDVLIGASLFPHLILPDDVVSSGPSGPPAIHTVLGYVLMGVVPALAARPACVTSCCAIVPQQPMDHLITRFWELEEVPGSPVQHPTDVECEHFYRSTTERDPVTGRYTVALPFDKDVFLLGDSYNIARKRFLCLEKKLEASLELRAAYDDVIKDYISKGYVEPLTVPPQASSDDLSPSYIIPHHGVLREDKSTTKLRPVLNASCKTSSGVSLNEVLHSGPNLQGDLFKIILNFRLHAVAMTADCKQMFLQIMLRESDRRYQRILYRFNPNDPLVLYQFNRVCFGLKSSPFHALRTVQQLVDDDGAEYPRAAEIVPSCLYMDDIAFSVDTEQEAVDAAKQLIQMFKGTQWDLVKWNSNSQYALNELPASHKIPTEVEFDKATEHKILGLGWSTDNDDFYFKIDPPDLDSVCTKRTIMSTIARLWDRMGFVAPTVLVAKLLIKKLWQLKVDWDEVPPDQVVRLWRQFCRELPALNEIKIPRCLSVATGCEVTLVGFADASEQAQGGVVYVHVASPSGNVVRLLCAKSKIAPTPPHTIARMELCAVLLLSKLLRSVLETYNSRIPIKVRAYTDSKVALYWIKNPPHRWQTFVANRVIKINENVSAENFHHVAGTDNPADCLSRGVDPSKLKTHPLWFNGPSWLASNASQWPSFDEVNDSTLDDVPEQRNLVHAVLTPADECSIYPAASRSSSWTKLLRIVVYICRVLKLLPRREPTCITATDLEYAETKLLQILQNKHFKDELLNIKNDLPVSPVLNKLRPFLHNDLIRVGGRLSNSDLDFDNQHPVLLPRDDHAVNLIIQYYHKKYLHAGPELLLSLLRQKYWILSARRVVRRIVHQCNVCFRARPRPTYPLMADLPDCRTKQVTKPFTHTGCDYAGPIAYTPVRRRGAKAMKAYICVFTCLTTRALHIEVATDLSTAGFLAALKRFLSRRGPVKVMHSDRGTNFVGANSYLRDLYKFLNSDEFSCSLKQELTENRIEWKFNCPASPHFGGCWESMVKVVKNHLFKVIGQQLLSYEELVTVLAQIESLLNSRPLTVLSADPAEPAALTPSHFLHTAPLLSLPAAEVHDDNLSLLHRHSLLDKLVQSFWRRWRVEYLHGLQTRQKWNVPSSAIIPGTVVVIIDDNAPPLSWPLAIVDKVHPSRDGVTRVVTVRTARGTYARPVQQSTSRPRVVRRGCEESELEDDEPTSIDHLLLLCHGVGSACDMRFRGVEEVVDDFRATSMQLIQGHYRSSYENGTIGRIEVLPISWHSTLHSGDSGVDRRLARITLDSIPRLRSFTNDTVLDVLFYTSPMYCQTIIDTVCKEINRIYELFKSRNPGFTGGVSLGGHSLGSVILYDLLCHQVDETSPTSPAKTLLGGAGAGPPSITYPALHFRPAALYALGSPIAMFECIRGVEHLGPEFRLPTCPRLFNIFHPYDPVAYRIEPLINPQLKEVPPSLIPHHKGRKRMHLELKETVARVGADLKQKLVESIKSTWASVWRTPPPNTLLLEKKLVESIKSTWASVWRTNTLLLEKVVEEELEKEVNKEEEAIDTPPASPAPVVCPNSLVARYVYQFSYPSFSEHPVFMIIQDVSQLLGALNGGARVDHVLQEAPFEMINEYLFAMSSHVGYW
ncbi:unnamed protein product [Plutella xylostella]|uniref:(diamondback moth) hypothetical protein n=1 Tax=Plutella xylostella TaxID=51655 RepID=A0A8S4EW90_PLUXY|nr:unnamed protein product [Plutella xylostella]